MSVLPGAVDMDDTEIGWRELWMESRRLRDRIGRLEWMLPDPEGDLTGFRQAVVDLDDALALRVRCGRELMDGDYPCELVQDFFRIRASIEDLMHDLLRSLQNDWVFRKSQLSIDWHGRISDLQVSLEEVIGKIEAVPRIRKEIHEIARGNVLEQLARGATPEAVDESLDVPIWDGEQFELRFQGKVIRKVRPNATNLMKVLSVFQECEWQPRVDSPFLPGEDQRIRETVRQLNESLSRIRFYTSGEGIRWQPVDESSR